MAWGWSAVVYCKLWLGAEVLYRSVSYGLGLKYCWSNIKDFVNVQLNHSGYLTTLPVVKLPGKSHALISLYQLYSHSCWIVGSGLSQFTQTVTRWWMWQTGELYICVWLSHAINLSRADMVTCVTCTEGLLDQPSRHPEFDRRHEGSVPVLRIHNC
jgi:sugar phosphate permease